jgi:flagellar hook-associated protein FlgK
MLDYIVLAPKIEDLERRLIGVAKQADAYSETVAKHVNDLKDRVAELEKQIVALQTEEVQP